MHLIHKLYAQNNGRYARGKKPLLANGTIVNSEWQRSSIGWPQLVGIKQKIASLFFLFIALKMDKSD